MAVTDYYVTTDAMGSVMAVLDETGNVLERRSYDAFGEATYMLPDGTVVPDSPTGVDIGFQGQLMDELTGMYQMGYRWYSPVLGRWVSRDPIGLEGGENQSVYCLNAPNVQTDYLGLDSCIDPCGDAISMGLFEKEKAEGLTICCNGVKYPCVAPDAHFKEKIYGATFPDDFMPIFKACTLVHEKIHVHDDRVKCDTESKCVHVASVYSGRSVWADTEYRARKAQIACLKEKARECLSAECKAIAERVILAISMEADEFRRQSGMPAR